MRVDALALALRPRPMFEAADLGVRLVQSHAGSVWRSFLPLYLVVAAFALASVEIAPWMPWVTVFCLKPWLDRSLLFVLSRAVFGEETRFADLWRARRSVWWQRLLPTLTLRRLSPWRSFTQPAHQLEGQHGAAQRARSKQLLRGRRGPAFAMHAAFVHLELFFIVALYALLALLQPDGRGLGILELFNDTSIAGALLYAGAYLAVVLALEPFYVAAGFAMYLNRRVELEAWDIEQEFRRAFAA
jgi:hypothetical protein